MALTRRFDEAFFYAHLFHRTHTPKGTPVPYISHLMAVAGIVRPIFRDVFGCGSFRP